MKNYVVNGDLQLVYMEGQNINICVQTSGGPRSDTNLLFVTVSQILLSFFPSQLTNKVFIQS